MLEEEIHYFDEHLKDLLARSRGNFALVKGSRLVGTFDTQEEALEAGARAFGLESFLVRRVEEAPVAAYVPALTLGLLRAGS
jgi:hypothetical protein